MTRRAVLLAALWSILAAMSTVAQAQRNPAVSTSVPLADVLARAQRYPNLRLAIRLQIVRAGLQPSAVTCQADHYTADWVHLAGRPLAPYRCRIGPRTLTIAARQAHYDRNGHRLDARDRTVFERAVRTSESGLSWQWR